MSRSQGIVRARRHSALLAALVVAILPVAPVGSPSGSPTPAAAAAVATVQTDCGGGRLEVPGGVSNGAADGTVPVVFVHGITSAASMWSTEAAGGGATLAQSIGALRRGSSPLPATSVWAFDYSDASIDWVTDRRIGPSLAEAIRCLHEASGNQVVLVAHSMGGLAIQFALGQSGVASLVAHVTTIGTPFEGSRILTALNAYLGPGGPPAPSLRILAEVVLEHCSQRTQEAFESGGDGCSVVGVPSSPVGTALMEGSSEIAALPSWPGSVPTFRVAGDLQLRPLPGVTLAAGDLAVLRGSALSGRVPDSAPPKVIECRISGNVLAAVPLPGVLNAQRCLHTELAHDREVIGAVLQQVELVVDRLADPVDVGGGSGEGEAEGAVVTPGFPPQIDVSIQGGSASAVYLAVADSFDDPSIGEAQAAAESVGYTVSPGGLSCDLGAADALGRTGAAVAVYFESEENAELARGEFEARGIPVIGVANVRVICLD
ncbi:MAG: esterase/lipase family protein [Acidimicrobiales bacterium]